MQIPKALKIPTTLRIPAAFKIPVALKIPVAFKRFRPRKVVNWLAITALTVIIIGFGWLHISPDYGVYLVKSESMKPSINMGDIVITRQVDSTVGGGVQPGMIVTYEHEENMLTHRVLSVEGDTVVTKGDANEEADPWTVALSDVKDAYLFKIPYLGYVSSFAGTKFGWFLLIIIPAMLLVALLIKEIMKEAIKKSQMEGDSFEEPTVRRHVETANGIAACAVPAGAVTGDIPLVAHDIPAPMPEPGPMATEIPTETTEPPAEEAATEFENLAELDAQTEHIIQAMRDITNQAIHDITAPMSEPGPTDSEIPAETTEPPAEEAATEFENLAELDAQTEDIIQTIRDITASMSELSPTASEIPAEAIKPPVEETATEFENYPEPYAQTEQITQAWTVEPGEALATADEIGKSTIEYIHGSARALEEWLTTLEKTAYDAIGSPRVPPGASPRFTPDAEAINKLVEQSVKGSSRAFQERLNSLGATAQIYEQLLACQPSQKELQHAV